MTLRDRLRRLEDRQKEQGEGIDAIIFHLLPASFGEVPPYNDRAICDGKEFFRGADEDEEVFTKRVSAEVREPHKVKLIWLHARQEEMTEPTQ